MTQEFHISITPVGNERYLVRTERVAPGVPLAEEQVAWPVEEWLAQARHLMNDPLVGALQSSVPATADFQVPDRPNALSRSLVELGQQFYSALFQGTLRDSWVTAQGIAQHRGEALRLRLGLKGTRLPRLPWEVLHGSDARSEAFQFSQSGIASRPLATGTHVIFSRYQPGAQLVGDGLPLTIEPEQPLRILMVIAAPTDQERLELQREASQLQQELRTSASSLAEGAAFSPDIQLTILNQPGREQLTQALEQGQYQVLHYAGHSNLGAAGGSLYLVNHRTGLTEILSGDDLAGLLVNNGVRLAVFNSCRGSYTAADPFNEQERNLAEALVSRGIPAVLAMAEQIPDNVALTLTWLFYRNLKQGYPIDLSLSRARQGMVSAYGSHQLYWALPVLYLHPEFDGYLMSGDRTFDNPADRLILMPQGYEALPTLAGEDSPLAAQFEPGDDELVLHAVLDEDDGMDWVEDLDYGDPRYDDDATVVADILAQVKPSPSHTATVAATADASGTLFDWSAEAEATTVSTADTAARHSLPYRANRGGKPKPSPPPVSPAVESSYSGRSSVRQGSAKPRALWLPLLGGGIAAIALLGFWLGPKLPHGSLSPSPTTGTQTDWSTQKTEDVEAIAINRFQNKQIVEAQQAVTALLDRNALKEAESALAAIPSDLTDTPALNYLQGRLAWQRARSEAMNSTNGSEQLSAARRYWERAVSQQPDSELYQQALGFAYYAENNLANALEAFGNARTLAENRQAQPSPDTHQSAATLNSRADELTTYAGMAIALWKKSVDQSSSPAGQDYLGKAIKTYQYVLSRNAEQAQPEELRKNWLWTEPAIQDWQTLSQL